MLAIFLVSEWLLMFVSISSILLLNIHIIISQAVIQDTFLPKLFYEIHENRSIKNHQVVSCLPQMSEIIQLAKSAADRLNSPPRIYQTSGNSVSLWPDQPGELETTYGTRGMQLSGEDIFAGTLPMTLKTVLEAGTPQGSYEVIFQSEWVSSNETLIHVWKFHVSADRQATFIGEEGDELPPLPM
jgi:hypothetical protein